MFIHLYSLVTAKGQPQVSFVYCQTILFKKKNHQCLGPASILPRSHLLDENIEAKASQVLVNIAGLENELCGTGTCLSLKYSF